MRNRIMITAAMVAAGAFSALPALAYDGQTCKAPGNCWEPKPGFPEKVAGSKYDPKHDPKEVGKQADLAIWNIDSPSELVYRMGFNPLFARIWSGQ